MGPFNVWLYVLASMTFFIDLLDVLLRLYLRREQTIYRRSSSGAATSVPLNVGAFSPYEMSLHVRPYAIVAAVHNLPADALDRFLEAMQAHRDRLWVIDDASTDDTWARLQAAGVRAIRSDLNRLKPASIKALVAELPPEIETVMVVDPDSRILTSPADVAAVIFEFQRSEMAAICPRICVRRTSTLTRFQQLEYSLSFSIGRKALSDYTLTSGIALYRRNALQAVLSRHSLSVYAEDLENALLLLQNGERLYYDGRLVVETDGMTTIRDLFSQRVGWSFGLIKVYASHWRHLLGQSRRGVVFTYQYVIYMGVFLLLLHPAKLIGIGILIASGLNVVDDIFGAHLIPENSLTSGIYFTAVYVKYTALALISIPLAVRRSERRDVLAIVPLYMFYAVAQVIPTTVGYLNWFSVRALGRRVFRDHYQPVAP